jgi:hypothetical protein
MNRSWRRDLGGADPYLLLGVGAGATRDEIVRAHRRRVRDLHPDLPTGDEEQTKLLHLARDVLLDPATRAEYDTLATGPEPEPLPAPDPPGAWDTEDVVDGTAPPRGRHPHPPSYAPPPRYPPPRYSPPTHPPPRGGAQPRPEAAPAFRPVAVEEPLTLPILALVGSVLCWPIGLIIGLVALHRLDRYGTSGRVLAIIAVTIAGVYTVCCAGWFGMSLFSQTTLGTPP